MASQVEAIIFDGDPEIAAIPDGLKTVPRTACLTMLPLTHEALEQLGAEDPNDDRIQPDWTLRRAVATLAERMSADRQVLYVFGETWAGPGIQEAAGWREGRLVSTAQPGLATWRPTKNLATGSSHLRTTRSTAD